MKLLKFVAISMLFVCIPSLANIEIEDDLGNKQVFSEHATRIVSLSPHITELLFSIGAGEQIVAVSDYSNYPKAASALPKVSGYQSINIEAILYLQPDVIVAWPKANPDNALAKLEKFGIPVLFSEPKSHQDIIDNLIWMGELSGKEQQARFLTEKMQQELESLRQNYQSKRPVNVFYQLSHAPLMTQNKDAFIHKAIELCGGVNIFADLPVLAPIVDAEAVIQRNPEVILASSADGQLPVGMERWKDLSFLDAAKAGALYGLPADLMHRPTARFFEGTKKMCELIDQARTN